MGQILNDVGDVDTAEVRRARDNVDMLEGRLGALGREAALLGASNIPVAGTVIDVGQALWNAWNGRWADAALDIAGAVPGGGDAAKTTIRGQRIARAVASIGRRLDAAKDALSRARLFARRQAASSRYWRSIRGRRNAIIQEYPNCRTGRCAQERDARLRQVSRLPATRGRWVDRHGNPAPAGSGYWKPDPDSPLADALSRHPNGHLGVPFRDGRPDFSAFPASGARGHDPTVRIDMSGNSTTDIKEAGRVFEERTGVITTGRGLFRDRSGTWHHEPDGVTMRYVDKDIHTAYKRADGNANPGTPHAGGDSMMRDPSY